MSTKNNTATVQSQATPLSIAREALRQLAQNRLPPTPDHYARAYQAIAAPGAPPDPYDASTTLREFADEAQGTLQQRRDAAELRAHVDAFDWPRVKETLLRLCGKPHSGDADEGPQWSVLIHDLIREWERRTTAFTQARKREMLEHVLTAFAQSPQLPVRLHALMRTWHESALNAPAELALELLDEEPRNVVAPAPVPAGASTSIQIAWDELLADTLTFGVVERLGYTIDQVREANELGAALRVVRTPEESTALAQRLRQFLLALEANTEDQREVQQGLLRLLQMLALNLTELVGNDSWLRGQLNAVTALAHGPVNAAAIASLESALRDVTLKQGVLKHSLDEAKNALRAMVTTFVERLATLSDNYGGYHDRLSGYATRIEEADDLSSLSDVVREVMQDTRGLQSDIGRVRDELLASRHRVEECEGQIQRLENEMAALSDRVHEDDLTHLLNRRGLARAFDAERARAERHTRPLCLALLDVDDFKHLNDRLGHAAGDNALVHLTRIVRRSLRPTDVICRYGGEEFVVLLPETAIEDAANVMVRAQRQLTKHLFLDRNERVLITFSAGVAQWQPGEARDEVIARADTALYRAKQAGKNRVAKA